MSVTGAVGEVANSFIKPKHLLVGLAVTAGTLFLLSRVVPGIGVMVGLNTASLVPLPYWPFQVRPGGRARQTNTNGASSGGVISALFETI